MYQNNESEINNAFTQGLIGLAAIFYVLKSMISEINQTVFISLIVFFVILSMMRVFGIILNIETLKVISVDLFSVLGVSFTFFVALRIIITELYPDIFVIAIIPTYFAVILTIYMFMRHYDLNVEIHVRKKK